MNIAVDLPKIPISESTSRTFAALSAAAMAGGLGFVAWFDPSQAHFLPVCPLLALTGFACPGCGLTRAFHSMFHGRFIDALDFNLMLPVWVVVFGWVFLSLVLTAIRKKGLPMWPVNPTFVFTFLIVLIIFGILRNLPFWPFTILYP